MSYSLLFLSIPSSILLSQNERKVSELLYCIPEVIARSNIALVIAGNFVNNGV